MTKLTKAQRELLCEYWQGSLKATLEWLNEFSDPAYTYEIRKVILDIADYHNIKVLGSDHKDDEGLTKDAFEMGRLFEKGWKVYKPSQMDSDDLIWWIAIKKKT